MVLVRLKWNKLTFDNLEVRLEDGVGALKNKIFELTGVPVSRQKLMAKNAWNGVLKDDADLRTVTLANNQQILLMGNVDTITAPAARVLFVEDMTSEQRAVTGVELPAGLINLGNTCYLNATVQCLRAMKDLKDVLQPIERGGTLANALKLTFQKLDTSTSGVAPSLFVQLLRAHFPRFAEQSNEGGFHQQDAEEFFSTVVTELANATAGLPNKFDSLLSIKMEEQLVCTESEAEPVIVKEDKVNKLICNIQGTVAGQPVNHIAEALKLGLETTVEKQSTVLNRNALWKKRQRVASLPKFLCMHFMRFFWKATPDSRDHRGVKCKILRGVSYPDTFDIYDFCTEDIQKKLRHNRQAYDKQQKALLDKKDGTSMDVDPPATAAASTDRQIVSGSVADALMTDELRDILASAADEDEREELRNAFMLSVGVLPPPVAAPAPIPAEDVPNAFLNDPNGLPANFTGLYELHSVVTHKGRSADSGHYIGWVRQGPGSNYWWKYDDDVVSEIDTDAIMKLKGGGDHDMVYLVFYRFKLPTE